MSQFGKGQADEIARAIIKQAERGRTGVANVAVRRVPRDEIERVLGEKTIARLARFRGFVGGAVAFLAAIAIKEACTIATSNETESQSGTMPGSREGGSKPAI